MEWLPIAIIAAILAGGVVGFLARRRTDPTEAAVRHERPRDGAASAGDGGRHGRDHHAADGGSGGDGRGGGDGGGGD